jgi:peptide subunit release factor RF-3
MITKNLQEQQQQNELSAKAKEIARLYYKKQVVNETQKKVLADTSGRIQEHIEGDFVKGGSWKTGETRLFFFPQSFKELPNKYPERFPDFAQGKMLKREKYPKGSNEFEEKVVYIVCNLTGTDIDKEKEWTPPYRTCLKIKHKAESGIQSVELY